MVNESVFITQGDQKKVRGPLWGDDSKEKRISHG